MLCTNISNKGYLNHYFSASVCCRYLGVSAQQIARWRKPVVCNLSISKICLRSSPTQLTVNEQAEIRNVLLDDKFIHLPFSYKWSVLLRNSSVVVGKSVFYKYAHLILGSFSKSEFHVSVPAVRASSCFEILHMDSTLVKTASGLRVYVHFVMDNFSKAILGAVCCENARSAVVAQNVKSVIEKYGLKSARVYSDDGPENHGEVEAVLKGSTFEQVFANFKLGKSNNMIEALNKKFKRFVLHNFSFETPADLEVLLPQMVDYYNNMLQPSLGHRSPLEVLNDVEEFKFDLVEARRKRIEVNKERCCLGDI